MRISVNIMPTHVNQGQSRSCHAPCPLPSQSSLSLSIIVITGLEAWICMWAVHWSCRPDSSAHYNGRPSAMLRTKPGYGRPLIALCWHFGQSINVFTCVLCIHVCINARAQYHGACCWQCSAMPSFISKPTNANGQWLCIASVVVYTSTSTL